MDRRIRTLGVLPLALLALGLGSPPAQCALPPGKVPLAGDLTPEELDQAYVQSFPQTLRARGAQPTALPDVFGPGSVLRAGNVVMKITNEGILGNPFVTSNDPAGQWPGASGIQYLNAIALAVGGVEQVNGQTLRRVTYANEFRPPSLDAEDKMYTAYEGIVNGIRNFDDDGDGRVDEDFLDGRDNDGDGRIDEDYDAQGQQMFACSMTDWSPQSVTANAREQHAPLGLRVNQKAWAYSLTSPNLTNFDVVEYTIRNESGNSIDSLYVGWFVDFDAGPVESSSFFGDDQDAPGYPQGKFIYDWSQGGQVLDPRIQRPHDPLAEASDLGRHGGNVAEAESALCQRQEIQINAFSIGDDDGDDNRTPGIPTFQLFGYTLDPTGATGPSSVGFRSFRSYTVGTPFNQGGNPSVDIERYEFMSGHDNIEQDPASDDFGLINAPPGDQKGDYVSWASVGPWLSLPNGGSITVTIGIAIQRGSVNLSRGYRTVYQAYRRADATVQGSMGRLLLDTYPSLDNAFTAQIAYEGIYETNLQFPATDFHGRETGLRAPPGQQFTMNEQCGIDGRTVIVDDRQTYWFDLDCNYCTGIWNPGRGGLFHKTWNTASPPPSPLANASVLYNFTDNPDRKYVPGGNRQVLVAWDNLSEISADPAPPNAFDFRGYKVWKAADWTRPVGSPGPAEEDWALIAEFRLFDYVAPSGAPIESNLLKTPRPCEFPPPIGTVVSDTPCVFIPLVNRNQLVLLRRGDLWNVQTGQVIHPDTTLDCVRDAAGHCVTQEGCVTPPTRIDCMRPDGSIGLTARARYPIGRYSYVDHSVKNGFTYFYSITAFDSANGSNGQPLVTESRRSAIEAEGVVPQAAPRTGKHVTVVPNPYRGYATISQRPSAWDLTPSSTDPTGTHIDFMGMPPGQWTLRIFTISGDLVQTIRSFDAVNAATRNPVTLANGATVPGVTLQQDNPDDGQATWNLISRNGQDIVSGVYLFTVDSKEGTQRGKFVVVR